MINTYPDWFVFCLSVLLGYLSVKDWIYLSISYYDLLVVLVFTLFSSLVFFQHPYLFFIADFPLKILVLSITLFLYFILIISKKMGSGDFWIFLFISFLLHYREILESLYLSILVGGIYSIILVLMDRKNLKKQIPFIPFLTIGFLLSIIFKWR